MTIFARPEDAGLPADMVIRKNPRARNISLRLEDRSRQFILTLPRGVSEMQGLHFARSRLDWMAQTLAALPAINPFLPGFSVPVLGVDHIIQHNPAAPARVTAIVTGRRALLQAGGPEAGFEIRVLNWLKRRARVDLSDRAALMANRLGVAYRRISIGDQKSRWGSCSAQRTLSFSWRLIMAPPEVVDYVVAHEVAHLREMNHSPAFWKLVADLMPTYKTHRKWLKTEGRNLAHFGPSSNS